MPETEILEEQPSAETPPVEAGEKKPPEKAPPVKKGEKKDWTTPLVIAGGAGVLGVGLWLYMRKKGVAAGSKMVAHFAFDYAGVGGSFILQVSLGHIREPLPGISLFDHVEGLTWVQEVELLEPNHYEGDVAFTLPDGLKAGSYDGEALIRTADMDWLDYFIKHETKGAIIVSD